MSAPFIVASIVVEVLRILKVAALPSCTVSKLVDSAVSMCIVTI